MAELVNLRRERKRRRRQSAADAAAVNRARHGQSKPTRELEQRRRERDATALDGKRLDGRGDDDGH